LTNAKRAPLLTLVLTLCMLATFFAAPEHQVSARTEVEGGSTIITSGDGLVRTRDGCVLVENGDRTVAAGSCDEQKGPAGQETTVTPETASPESALPEGTTTAGEEDLCPTEPPADATRATVARVVDGDTLQLADEAGGTDRVRLIGVDAPELQGEDGRPEPYVQDAAAFTADALESKDVLLVPGEDETDDYGRLLAYVWTTPEEGLLGGLKRMIGAQRSEFFNRTLLREGYAEVLTIRPNDAYADCFEAAQREAQGAGEGIWGTQETTFLGETTSSTDVASPEPTSPESTPEPTTPTVPEHTVTPEDTSEEPASFSQEQTIRLEQRDVTPVDEGSIDRVQTVAEEDTAGEEPDAATRRQYEDAWPPITAASQYPSDETTSGTGIHPTSSPVADTPQVGTVPVLPETGGRSLLSLFVAMGLISLGLAALLANNASPGDRPEENRDEDLDEDLDEDR
jgi:micrococcal nuclease